MRRATSTQQHGTRHQHARHTPQHLLTQVFFSHHALVVIPEDFCLDFIRLFKVSIPTLILFIGSQENRTHNVSLWRSRGHRPRDYEAVQ